MGLSGRRFGVAVTALAAALLGLCGRTSVAFPVRPLDAADLTQRADCVCKVQVVKIENVGTGVEPHFAPSSPDAYPPNRAALAKVISVIKGTPAAEVQIMYHDSAPSPFSSGRKHFADDELCIVFLKQTKDGYAFLDALNGKMAVDTKDVAYPADAVPQQRLLAELIVAAKSQDAAICQIAVMQIGNWAKQARRAGLHDGYSVAENAYGEGEARKLLRDLRKSKDSVTRAAAVIASLQLGDAPTVDEVMPLCTKREESFVPSDDTGLGFGRGKRELGRLQPLFFRVMHESCSTLQDAEGRTIWRAQGEVQRGVSGFDYAAFCTRALRTELVKEEDALRAHVVHVMWNMDDPRNIPDAVSLLDDKVEHNRSSAIDFLRKVVLHLPQTDYSELEAAKAREADDVRYWKQWWQENQERYKAPAP